MKKVLSILLTIALLLTFAACGKGKKPTPTDDPTSPQASGGGDSISDEKETQPTLPEDWGVDDKRNLFVGQNRITVHFKWPAAEGITAGTGRAGEQSDGTWVMVDGYVVGTSPDNVALKDFYPAYTQQTEKALRKYYGTRYKNGSISVDSGVLSTIGEYEVCKYTGKHTYEYDGEAYEHPFVVYATTVKGNGALIYWLVEDITEDQSAGKQVEENAYRIILSIWEDE